MADIKSLPSKKTTKRRRSILTEEKNTSVSTPSKIIIKKDLKLEHKFFINSIFSEMIEKI
ncbi:hypothetical protein SCB49_12649 [unidentified eubacterium SCB49]|nr:hypothetical protein SCB49_12649 [unidentified eubacterium SCB49]